MELKTKTEIKGLGTFGGVFVPNILTILGVIMYLRMGWVVGNAGLFNTLIILLIANSITLLTALSMSSIATNMKVKGGGAYFMISRSFGAEAGGGVGIPLYIAQTIGIGLYLVGFSESIISIFPDINQLLVSGIALVALTAIALYSSTVVVKIQYIILIVVGLSLVSFFAGKSPEMSTMSLASNYGDGYGFWAVFAVFFPAVTGILSGVSMSGDLKNPQKSIPMGTLLAVGVGALIYFSMAIWLSGVASPSELIINNSIIMDLSRWSPLIFAGIWGATLSSAIANILAAPRTMQALAMDGILFKSLKKGQGEMNEPVIATIITFVFAFGVLLMGDLNVIAPILTMFFLITYGSINLISFIEGLIDRPSFRPTFKIHWSISLMGALSTIMVMFIINVVACILGFGFVIAIYVLIKKSQMKKNWGDIRRGIWSSVIQYALKRLDSHLEHPQNWRPNILLFSKNNSSRRQLAHIANSLAKRRGFITFINLLEQHREDMKDVAEEMKLFKEFLKEEEISGFANVAITDNMLMGQLMSAQVHGIGQYRQNTIMLEWSDSGKKWSLFQDNEMHQLFKLMHLYRNLNMSLLFLSISKKYNMMSRKHITLWWDPTQENGSFSLLLAHLIATSDEWEGAAIHLKSIVLEEKVEETRALLEELVQKSRIEARIDVYHPDPAIIENLENKSDIVEDIISSKGVLKIKEAIKIAFTPKDSEEEAVAPQDDSETKIDSEDEIEMDVEESSLKRKLADQVDLTDARLLGKTIKNIIIEESKHADLVLLGFNLPKQGEESAYIKRMNDLLEEMPTTLLINCPFDVDLFG
ncbi:MAG: Na-K-Cl cotransporter [Candidatus Marinimicrobia bacterium]|nr:Na-K-Cl cotransporter [Candidatus Neomarinimicrobiota bacterium]